MCRSFLIGIVLLALAGAAAADGSYVRARLVADGPELVPGGKLHLGVLFETEPGWHIYWKNPGDSGLSTSVEWGLPRGFTAGPVRWPVPIRFVQPGDLDAYGYEGTVLLASELKLPPDLATDGLEVSASVSWLACKDKCVLGSAELRERLPLPVAAQAFEAWRASLAEGIGPFSVSTVGSIDPATRRGKLSIWLEWEQAPPTVEWFPEADEHLKVSDVQVRSRGKLTRIDFDATVVGEGGGSMDTMNSVVVADGEGYRRGWQLAVPLAGSS